MPPTGADRGSPTRAASSAERLEQLQARHAAQPPPRLAPRALPAHPACTSAQPWRLLTHDTARLPPALGLRCAATSAGPPDGVAGRRRRASRPAAAALQGSRRGLPVVLLTMDKMAKYDMKARVASLRGCAAARVGFVRARLLRVGEPARSPPAAALFAGADDALPARVRLARALRRPRVARQCPTHTAPRRARRRGAPVAARGDLQQPFACVHCACGPAPQVPHV